MKTLRLSRAATPALTLAVLALGVAACGKTAQNPFSSSDDEAPTEKSASEVGNGSSVAYSSLGTSSVTEEAVNTALDEVASAIADDIGGASAGTNLVDDSLSLDKPVDDLEPGKDCKDPTVVKCEVNAEGTEAKVSFELDWSAKASYENPALKRKQEMSIKDKWENVWTKAAAGAKLECVNNRAKIGWDIVENVVGLKLKRSIDRSRDVSASIDNVKSGKSSSVERHYSAKGVRNVGWTAMSYSADKAFVTRSKEVTFSVDRSSKGTRRKDANGTVESFDFTASFATKEGAPLKLTVKRKASNGRMVQETVESGTVVAVGKNKERIETTYDKVVFSMLGSHKCLPVSGTLSGKVYDAAGKEIRSFTVTYSSDDPIISTLGKSFKMDSAVESMKGCDLEAINHL